jgi:hypothetical protein
MTAQPRRTYTPRGRHPFVQCRLAPDAFEALEQACARLDVARAEVVRRGVEMYLESEGLPTRATAPNPEQAEMAFLGRKKQNDPPMAGGPF